MMSVSCLIPAAGWGERFKRSSPHLPPKLDLPLGGQKLLEKTLEPFLLSPEIKEIVIAVPPKSLSSFRKRVKDLPSRKVRVVAGGRTRTDSVHNALKASDRKNPWVIVHDGARPMLSLETLSAFLKMLSEKSAVIVARPVHPTLKRAKGLKIETTVSRDNLWEAETPQGFKRVILEKAYASFLEHPFHATDEASLVERMGTPIFLFKNESPNLKITEFSDYEIVRKIMGGTGVPRNGIGFDVHRLVKDRPLILGGLRIPHPKGALGHSDGDAVLHALSDALLGALALGDIGEHFSDKSKQTKGMASSEILKQVYSFVKEKGYRLSSADINVILENPRLGPLKNKMRKRIADIMDVPENLISIKARTAEGLGSIGKGEAVSAQAVVTVVKND